MAKNKIKRTYTGSTSVITTRRTSDDSVTVYKDTYTDRETTFRKEQPGVFGILTSMTTYVIIFMLLLFGTSAIHYQNNQENLSWIDANGEFKTSSYNVTVSYNLDTPLDDLNGYSLKEVFLNNNLIENYKPEEPVTSSQWYLKPTIQFDNGYFKWSLSTNLDFIIAENITINHNDDFYLNFNMYTENANGQIVFGGITGGSVFPNTSFSPYVQGIYSNIFTVKSSGNASRLDIRMTGNTGYVYTNNFYMISLTDLGINQTKDEMDYWYNEYLKLSQGNMLEDLKTLGAMPLASWNTMNEVTRSLIDIYEFGMKLVFPVVDVVRNLIKLI